MNILLTGGTGLIGRALCQYWQQPLSGSMIQSSPSSSGSRALHQIWVLSRTPQKIANLCGQGVLGVSSLSELDEAHIAIDAVVNLAGAPIADKPWTQARKDEIWTSRVNQTQRLVAWMGKRAEPPQILISGSAIGYYGDCGDQILDEDYSEPPKDFASELCRQWELEALQALPLGVRTVRLRTSPVLSADGGFLSHLLPIYRLGLGGPLGTGQQWMSWIHIQDMVAMIDLFLHNKNTQGAYNICSPNPVRAQEFAKILGQALHRPAFVRAPTWALRFKLGAELAAMVLASQRVMPKRVQEAGFEFQFAKLSDALKNILDR